jgi:fucose permease
MVGEYFPAEMPWASLYFIFAAVALLMAVIVFLIKHPKVELKEDEKSGAISTYVSLLGNKVVILYFVGIFCYVGAEQGIGNWISQFLLEYHVQDPQIVGASVVSYFWGMLTIGCFAGLLILKLMDSRKVLAVFSALTIVALFTALFGSLEVTKIAFPLIGFFISVMWSVIFSLGMNSMSDHHGSVSGILCSGIAGGAIVPLIVGGLGEGTSLKTGMAFLVIPLAYILSIGFWAKPLITNKTIS